MTVKETQPTTATEASTFNELLGSVDLTTAHDSRLQCWLLGGMHNMDFLKNSEKFHLTNQIHRKTLGNLSKLEEDNLVKRITDDKPRLMCFHKTNANGGHSKKSSACAMKLIKQQIQNKGLVLISWPNGTTAPTLPGKTLHFHYHDTCTVATNIQINPQAHAMSPKTQALQSEQILESSVYKSNSVKTKKKVNFKSEDSELELGDHMALDDSGQKEKPEWWKLKRDKPVIEDGTDDCGDNLDGLGSVPDTLPDDSFAGFAESYHDLDRLIEKETDHLQDLASHYFHGSSVHGEKVTYHSGKTFQNLDQLKSAFFSKAGRVDIIEIFGGKAGVTKVAIRKKLTSGGNFDLVTGVNLLDPKQKAQLLQFIRDVAPLVIIMGPPCTAFAGWSAINALRNPEGYAKVLAAGTALANLAHAICLIQMKANRHWIVENPTGSKLWTLPNWTSLLQDSRVRDVCFHQCSLGLVDPDGKAVYKPTRLAASHPCLLYRLLPYRCPRDHVHQQIAGSAQGESRSKWAQVWPRKMCDLIVAGISELRVRCVLYYFPEGAPISAFPATDAADATLPQPISCPGCRAHAYRGDSRHTRKDDCRFPNTPSDTWSCPGCIRHLPSHHPVHNKQAGSCHWAEAPTRIGASSVAAAQRGPQPTGNGAELVEAPQNAADGDRPPHTNTGERWTAVSNDELITTLRRLYGTNGWMTLANKDVALVTPNGRWLRGVEPRYSADLFETRSSYAIFTDYPHDFGMWWQLENRVDFKGDRKNLNLGYPVDVLVSIYHLKTERTEPAKENNPSIPSNQHQPGSALSAPASGAVPRQRQPIEQPLQPQEFGDDEVLPPPVEANQEALPTETPDWSSFDLGRSLRTLRSGNKPVIIRTLRSLHMKWWHCSIQKMTNLLKTAGVASEVLAEIKAVVDSCRICRQWKRPGDKAVTSTRLSQRLGECVQIDLLFVKFLIVLHMVDECTRFSMTRILKDRTTESILEALTESWLAVFGPPTCVMTDREGALCSEQASIWTERLRINLLLRAPGQHAPMVERHHQTMRDLILKIDDQCLQEGLQIPYTMKVAIATNVKNAVLSIGGVSPQQAATGQVPALLGETEEPTVSELDDQTGPARHLARAREIAVRCMIEETSKQRVQRAEQSRSRLSGEQLDLAPGMLVDIYRTPKSKDLSGWRGPCTVTSVHHLQDGFIDVSWSGRSLAVKISDIRKAMQYLAIYAFDTDSSLDLLRRYILSLQTSEVHCIINSAQGWTLSQHARNDSTVLRAIVRCAYVTMHLPRCVGGRVGRNASTINGMWSIPESLLMWWPDSNPQAYKSFQVPGTKALNLKELFGGDSDEWRRTSWIQFFCATTDEVSVIRRDMELDIPHLGAEGPNQHPGYLPHPDPNLHTIPEEDNNGWDDEMPDPYHGNDFDQMPITRQVTPEASTIHMSPVSTRRSHNSTTTELGPSASHQMPSPQRGHKRSAPGTSSSVQHEQLRDRLADNYGMKRGHPDTSSSVRDERDRRTQADPSQPSNPQPELPIQTSSSRQSDDDAETQLEDDDKFFDALFSVSKHGPVVPEEWCLYPGLEQTVQQQVYLFKDCPGAYIQSPAEAMYEAEDGLEIEIHPGNEGAFAGLPTLQPGEVLVYKTLVKKFNNKKPLSGVDAVIERSVDALTAEDIKQNWDSVLKAQREEIASFDEHECFELSPRTENQNTCTSRWVLRWKLRNQERIIKARLVIRGFQDKEVEVATYSSCTTRWGQRLVTSLAVIHKWELNTLDVGTAFLRGLSFSELSQIQETPERVVAFEPPRGSEALISERPKHSAYNPQRHVLRLLKAAYGLRDAPRAWRTRLDRALKALGAAQVVTDGGLYCLYDEKRTLILILSCHVDDLKIAATLKAYQRLKQKLEESFGKLTEQKAYMSELEHCGLMHQQLADYSIRVHQNHYSKQLRNITIPADLKDKLAVLISGLLLQQYMSLLGAAAWLTQTRADVAIYITALQRATVKATIGHVMRLNKVVRYLRNKPLFLYYPSFGNVTLSGLKILCISDSAYRREDATCLAMRGAIITLSTCEDERPGGLCHTLEFYSRRQRKITRSTYAAETMSLADAVELARVVSQTLTSIYRPDLRIRDLISLEEQGQLAVPTDAVVDCKSVFDSLAAPELQIPSESGLILVLAGLKEMLQNHSMRRIWWVNTQSMLSDGLNKGIITRRALVTFSQTGFWQAIGEVKKHQETQFRPTPGAMSFLDDDHDQVPAVRQTATFVI